MGTIEGDRSAGRRVLAEILGKQVAWWQLGFAVRRDVLRAARRGIRFPDQDVWQVAVGWARQWLAAPRWWRVVRDVGVTLLAMVCFVALATVLADDVDGLVMSSGATAVCLPLAACWGWRQARHARMLVAMAPESPHLAPSSRFAVRALMALLAAGTAAATLTVAVAYESASLPDCPRFTIDAPVRDWLTHVREGCPTGDTLVGDLGLRYTPWSAPERFTGRRLDYVVYVSPSAYVFMVPVAIFDAWIAEGGPSGRLGPPIDNAGNDLVAFMNFRGGAIVVPAGGTPTVHMGLRYSGARDPDSACVPHDRPCIVTAHAEGADIRVRWHYGAADAFLIGWWPLDEPGAHVGREVAGYQLTLRGLRPSTVYVVEVAACRKRFLRRSVCTPSSTRVIVRVG